MNYHVTALFRNFINKILKNNYQTGNLIEL